MCIKAVLFDMDGVILDTERLFFKNWRLAAKLHGFEMSAETALHIRSLAAKFAIPYLKEQLGEDFDYAAVRSTRKQLMEQDLAEGIPLKPGVFQLLDILRKHKIPAAVVTATDYERTRRYLTRAGIFDRFDKIICAPMVAVGKPAPDVYLYACEQLGLNPDDCLALEDSPNGVKSAFDAGCRVCMVPDLTKPDADTVKMLTACAENLLEAAAVICEDRK